MQSKNKSSKACKSINYQSRCAGKEGNHDMQRGSQARLSACSLAAPAQLCSPGRSLQGRPDAAQTSGGGGAVRRRVAE